MNNEQMSLSLTLPVTELQRFCMHDGPGVRTVVFLKGCPLRCVWCHNPETQRAEQEILFYGSKCIGCGACASACPRSAHEIFPKRRFDREACVACGRCAEVCCTCALTPARREMTVAEIVAVVLRDKSFYGTEGGITLSGGEPMCHPMGSLALLSACRNEGLTTCVETCGYFDPQYVPSLVETSDLLLWDVKDTNAHRHKAYTGVSNSLILDNLAATDAMGGKTRLRCILVAGVNAHREHYEGLARLVSHLSHCEGVEFIPYHAYGGSKMLPLGLPDNGRADMIPTEEMLSEAKAYLTSRSVRVL